MIITSTAISINGFIFIFPQYLDFLKTPYGRFVTLRNVRNDVRNCMYQFPWLVVKDMYGGAAYTHK
jgi:hypothetical protein